MLEWSPILEQAFSAAATSNSGRGLAAQSSPVTGPAARRKARGLTATSKATPSCAERGRRTATYLYGGKSLAPFILVRGQIVECRMTAMGIVPSFNEVKDRQAGFGLRSETGPLE